MDTLHFFSLMFLLLAIGWIVANKFYTPFYREKYLGKVLVTTDIRPGIYLIRKINYGRLSIPHTFFYINSSGQPHGDPRIIRIIMEQGGHESGVSPKIGETIEKDGFAIVVAKSIEDCDGFRWRLLEDTG